MRVGDAPGDGGELHQRAVIAAEAAKRFDRASLTLRQAILRWPAVGSVLGRHGRHTGCSERVNVSRVPAVYSYKERWITSIRVVGLRWSQ